MRSRSCDRIWMRAARSGHHVSNHVCSLSSGKTRAGTPDDWRAAQRRRSTAWRDGRQRTHAAKATAMKVLYLVPQAKHADRLGAYSFLDEEIEALAVRGVQAYVLSTAAPVDTERGGVRVISVAARTTIATRLRALTFLGRRLRTVPAANLLHGLKVYRSARIEHLAAAIVKEERIDLIHSHFGWPQGFGGLLAKAATGVPLVASIRGTDILLDRSIGYGRRSDACFDRAVRRLLRVADRTVYFSNYMRDRAIALGARP